MKNEHVSPPTGDWRLRLGRTKRLIGISETHLKCPPQIAEVTILIGSAPTWTGQPKAKTTLEIADFRGKIETYIEKSPMHISLLKARITPDLVDDMENLQIRITHDVTLQERGLVQEKDSSSQKINESDRIAYCRATQTLDFNNPIFEKFCTDNNLIKST